ncbi:MAG TPA: hypothetical protein PLG31_00970 [Spirochaetota bacterium]|nr:hypothetical protein [Spirochaetota bacterium]
MNTNPLIGFIRTLGLIMSGRVLFLGSSVGKQLAMPDGRVFTVFRHVKIRPKGISPDPEAVFLVRFKPRRMSDRANRVFSLLPMLVFMGFRGFRQKYWAVEEGTGLCQGLYEWQTMADAGNYANSIAMRFMRNRSLPESVSFEIIDQRAARYWAFG